ncbi:MAG: hypothetical protein RL728_294 [Bacteroidota bacterium]|jgi:hypothetical protein
MQITWTEIALDDYDECICYLENYFSEKEILNFIFQMDYSINLIQKNPFTFPISDYKNVRYLVVIPQITIFYSVQNDKIHLLRVFSNRKQKPSDM